MAETKQLNIEISKDLITRAKVDAIESSVSLAGYCEVALAAFLSKPQSARRVNLQQTRPKIAGRKIATK